MQIFINKGLLSFLMGGIEELVLGIHNIRVLVIDDCEFVAEHVATRLSEHYAKVDHISNSANATGLILESIANCQPYQALVLDLDMPEVNGIQLLQDLNKKGINVPTVLFSAEQGDYLAIRFIHQVNKAQHTEELNALIDNIEKGSNGLPITYLRKFEGDAPIQDLVNAIDAVTIISQRRQVDFANFVSRFSAKESGYHFDNNHIAQMADIVRLTRQRYMELKERLLPYRAFMKKKESEALFKNIDWFINDLADDKFSLSGLSDPKLGRNNIHQSQIYYRQNFLRDMFKGYLRDPSERLLVRYKTQGRVGDITAIMQEFEETHRSMAKAFEYHTLMSKEFTVKYPCGTDSKLHNLVESPYILRGSQGVNFQENYIDKGLKVEANEELFTNILEHPLLNAVDAVQGSAEKTIYLETRKVDVESLPDKEKDYFIKLGYKPNDSIVRILIKDTGCGIPQENLDKIAREGFSTKGSSGYGLSFVDKRIGEIPGTYRIESQVGKGTSFYMYFPVCK